jgi:hypothetical protein
MGGPPQRLWAVHRSARTLPQRRVKANSARQLPPDLASRTVPFLPAGMVLPSLRRLTRRASTRRPWEGRSAGRRKRLSRASQQKPARPRIAIHLAFDGQQQFRSALDSSIISKPSCRTKALGSASAAARTAWSSRHSSRAPGDPATISSAKVLLPTWRAPVDHHDTGVRQRLGSHLLSMAMEETDFTVREIVLRQLRSGDGRSADGFARVLPIVQRPICRQIRTR